MVQGSMLILCALCCRWPTPTLAARSRGKTARKAATGQPSHLSVAPPKNVAVRWRGVRPGGCCCRCVQARAHASYHL